MRKQNRECLDPAFFDEVFSTAEDLCLAMHDGEFPYVIPLNFVRQGACIYIHCALEGRKLDCIRRTLSFSRYSGADALQYFHQIFGFGIFQVVHTGITLTFQLSI